MEVQEKKQGPALAAAGGRAHAPAQPFPQTLPPGVPPPATQPLVQPAPAARRAEPAIALTPEPSPARSASGAADPVSVPDRMLAWVDAHRRKLLVAVIVLYALGFNGQWRLEPDSALYLTIGRNLAEGRGYTYHGEHHHLAYPGMPWLFAGLFKVFGTESVAAHDVVMLACVLATLALVYRLFLLHADR